MGDTSGWYLLDPKMTVKFTANGEDYPAFISVIPLILDLDEAQALDRKKTMQRLLKVVIQKIRGGNYANNYCRLRKSWHDTG